MALFERAPLVRAEVALYGPRRAAAMLHPASGRWPAHEAADRLAIGVGMAALGAHGSSEPRWAAYRDALARVATGIVAAGAEPLPGDLVPLERLGVPGSLAVVAWEGPGAARVEAELLEPRGGLVPRLADAPGTAGPAKEIAALTLLVALAVDGDADARLALGLGVEGVVAWFRESDRRAAPRNALAFALAHARDRLGETGRSLPPGL
jgi:hypothetical protein